MREIIDEFADDSVEISDMPSRPYLHRGEPPPRQEEQGEWRKIKSAALPENLHHRLAPGR